MTRRDMTDGAGEYRYAIDGANGENLVTSEGYTRPEDRDRGYADLEAAILGDRVAIPQAALDRLPRPILRRLMALAELE